MIILLFGWSIRRGSFLATDPTPEATSSRLISASSLGTSTTVYVQYHRQLPHQSTSLG